MTNMTFRIPPEWDEHRATWLAWPWLENEWSGKLTAAQNTIAEICELLVAHGETVMLLSRPETPDISGVTHVELPYGDCWVRDTLPIFATQDEILIGLLGNFNGWGGKFDMPGDSELAERICTDLNIDTRNDSWSFEGGSFDFNGAGIGLTTTSCLMHPARNRFSSVVAAQEQARATFSLEQCILLSSTLTNDHTDGHIDNLARFVSQDTILVTQAEPSDLNYETLCALRDELTPLPHRIEYIPSPGLVKDALGNLAPASYLNFYIGNGCVLMPTFGVPQDEKALDVLQSHFPKRECIGVRADPLLVGGGTIHCCTMQQPLGGQ